MSNFDQLYSEYDDEELEIKMALKSVIRDERVVNEAARLYQLGKSQDLIYAEQMLLTGSSFKTVEKTVKSNIKKRASARPTWDTKLRIALIKSKGLPDEFYKYDAHHVVAKGAKRAKQAAEILFALGIDIDDPDNGVFMPKNTVSKQKGAYQSAYIHNKVHTKPYYANVNFQVVTAFENGADKEEMKKILKDIKEDLINGVYPINQYIPGAEVFA